MSATSTDVRCVLLMNSLNQSSTGQDIRLACRLDDWTVHTSGLAVEFAQANLVILSAEHADDFQLFCERNPKPCPLLEITQPGNPVPIAMAGDADLRTDLPRYRVWREGKVTDEPTEISQLWRDDLVSFLIGCSFTFDAALLEAGLPVRHVEEKCNVPMYRTTIDCKPAGSFSGPLVVSMRPFRVDDVAKAVELTARFPHFHGSPVHQGDPHVMGIDHLSQPDFGDAVPVNDDEVPVFWACGVTPQCALESACLPFAITHAPGHMFVTDRKHNELL